MSAAVVDDSRGGAVMMREVRWTDVPVLAQADRVLFAEDAWSEPTWWAELAGRPRRDYVVAQAPDGTLAGYAGVDCAGDTADVMTIAVCAAYRGLGLGDRLLGELAVRAASAGAQSLLLEVRADNVPALALYARHGFEQVSVRRRYYQPGDVDALVMRRRLP
jgi:ribosomal-protein-alanine N-acetyltransferase